MSHKNKYTNLPILFAIGSACFFVALSFSVIDKKITAWNAGLGLLGLVCIALSLVWLAQISRRPNDTVQNRKFGIILVIWLFSAVAINLLTFFYNIRWDVTYYRQHTLSESSKGVIRNVNKDILITVFYPGMPPKFIEDLLKEYEESSKGRIKSEIIDPLVDLGYASQFGKVIHAGEKKVFVTSGLERVEIDFTKEELDEGKLTNALIRSTRATRIAYFLAGHGESNVKNSEEEGLAKFAELLQDNNVEVHQLLLDKGGKIPADCDILIVAGPKKALMPEEEQQIQNYLKGGGDALFLIESVPLSTPDKPLTDAEKAKNPNLNSLLKDWGIIVGDDVVVDLDSHVSGDVGCPATKNYPPHKEIVNGLDYTFYIRPRSISLNPDRLEKLRIAPLVLTASKPNSWAEKNRFLKVKFDEGEDLPGPVMFGAVIWDPKSEQKSSDTLIAVITDVDFLTNAFIEKYSNAQFGLNVVRWLSQSLEEVYIDPKKIAVAKLNLTSQQKRVIAVSLVLLPVGLLTLGLAFWIRKKMA